MEAQILIRKYRHRPCLAYEYQERNTDQQLENDLLDLPLRNIYLNANGIGAEACKSIASFLASPACTLESLYMSLNPVGDAGSLELAAGLQYNRSLTRLTVASCGLKAVGASAILSALTGKSNLMTLKLNQHYATEDLNMRYNYLEDGIRDSTLALLSHPDCKLRMLDLGLTALSAPVLNEITTAVAAGIHSLTLFRAKSIHGKFSGEVSTTLQAKLQANVAVQYDGRLSYAEFLNGEQRWLMSPKDVRLIDSGYRNKDAGLARRGKMVLDKHWEDGGKQLKWVIGAGDSDSDYEGASTGDI